MKRRQLLLVLLLPLLVTLTARADRIPDFTLDTGNGALRLADLRGKVVYLDFWASWCVPCRASFPWMNAMQTRHRDKGFVVVAVNLDSERAEAQRFLDQYPAAFTVAFDPEGKTARTLALKGMPTSFLIGRDGEIVATHIGFREASRGKLEDEIQALLAR